MFRFIMTLVLFNLFIAVSAQKVFSVEYANQADVKVFVVKYENQADLKVFKVKYENQAGENNGKVVLHRICKSSKEEDIFCRI
jgi:hypothetical protein